MEDLYDSEDEQTTIQQKEQYELKKTSEVICCDRKKFSAEQ